MKTKHLHHKQSGAALLAFMLIMVAGLSFAFLTQFNSARQKTENNMKNVEALQKAKEAVITWAVNHPIAPGTMPFPDRNGDGNYDGDSDCSTSSPLNYSLLLGKLPWRGATTPCTNPYSSMGLSISESGVKVRAIDSAGEEIWYAVSRNLLNTGSNYPAIGPNTLDINTDWITVRDRNGNILSNRVAFVLISPGIAFPDPAISALGQDRSTVAPDAKHYLDVVTVGGTEYRNYDTTPGPDGNMDFIIYPDSDTTSDPDDYFNDQLLFVTIDELFEHIEKRVISESTNILSTYQSKYGALPWLSPFDNPDNSPFRSQLDTGTSPKTGWRGHIPFHWSDDPYSLTNDPDSDISDISPFSTSISLAWNITTGAQYDIPATGTVSEGCIENVDCDDDIFPVITQIESPSNVECTWTNKNSSSCSISLTVNRETEDDYPDPGCPSGGRLTRTYVINYPSYTGISTINPPTSTSFRTRDIVLTGSLPDHPSFISIQDICVDEPTPLLMGNASISLNGTTGTISTKGIKYDLDLDVDDGEIPEWFVKNGWHKYIYIAYPEAEDLPGDSNFANACTAGTDCLTIHLDVDDEGNTNPLLPSIEDARAVAIYSGKVLTPSGTDSIGNPLPEQTRHSASLSDYFEGDPDVAPQLPILHENANEDEIYIINPPSSQFNDKLIFFRTCTSDNTKLCRSE